MTGPRLITVREAAEVLRCHPKTVERAVRAGRIPATLFAGRYLIRPRDLPTPGSHPVRVRPAPREGSMRAIAHEITQAEREAS